MNTLPYIITRLRFPFYIIILTLPVLFATHPITARQGLNALSSQTSLPSSDNNLLILNVTVTEGKKGYAWGLKKENFTVYDDKAPKEITFFEGRDTPVSIGLLLDASGSMNSSKLKVLREGLMRFLYISHSSNDYFLIGFNERPEVLLDWTQDITAIVNKIASVEPKLNTAFYDACYLGLEKVTRGKNSKHVLLLMTDGQDNQSTYKFKELHRALKESNVLVYAIGFLGRRDSSSSLAFEGQAILDELTSITGGKAYFPDSKDGMKAAFELIALELRHQYRIGFIPARDGKWHQLNIKVALPSSSESKSLSTRSRVGYRSY